MSSRRSRPPRGRKSRAPEAPAQEIIVTMPPATVPPEELAIRNATPSSPTDELAALDAGWDDLLV